MKLKRFLGFIEGVIVSLPNNTQSIVFDYLAVVDSILDNEETNHPTEKGGVQE